MSEPSRDELIREIERLEARIAELEAKSITSRETVATMSTEARLALLDTVFAAIHHNDLASALEACVVAICEHSGWDLGEGWLPTDGQLGLVSAHVASGADEARLRPFVELTRRTTLASGVGLPGRVWEMHQPLWFGDFAELPPGVYPRLGFARDAGLQAGLGVPVLGEDEVLAVLAFYSSSPAEENRAYVRLVTSVAQQLGLMLRHERARQRIERLENAAVEWSMPILQVWDGIVMAPLVGDLDARRMAQLQDRVLAFLESKRAKVVLVDVTGVPAMETWVAQELISLARGARMLGAQAILTGIRPALSRTLVHLGVSFDELASEATLAAGLHAAIDLLSQPIGARSGRRV